jgi:hypothetical protein
MKTSTDEEDSRNLMSLLNLLIRKKQEHCCYVVPGFMPSFLFLKPPSGLANST